GEDKDLIGELERMAIEGTGPAAAAPAKEEAPAKPAKPETSGTLVAQTLERALRPGEVSLDELERAFRETASEAAPAPAKVEAKAEMKTETKAKAAKPERKAAIEMDEEKQDTKVANQSIRVNVETLENLMTMVSELVLTRNQLLEIVRRHEDSEFKV